MNINRLRPTGVKREDLDVWLSGVILDAIRDAMDAGMPQSNVYDLLQTITAQEHPHGVKAGQRERLQEGASGPLAWVLAHPELKQQYAGKHVAVASNNAFYIIAEAITLDALVQLLELTEHPVSTVYIHQFA